MVAFLMTIGVLALLAVAVWATYHIWEAFETIDHHDRKIDEAAIDIKSFDRRLAAIDKELISIHQSILRLNLALEETERKMNDKEYGGGWQMIKQLRDFYTTQRKIMYYCDPGKNMDCKKTNCKYLNGGECEGTLDESLALRSADGRPLVLCVLDIDQRISASRKEER